jgi:transcriptional regulator with XRE-family HTH domain
MAKKKPKMMTVDEFVEYIADERKSSGLSQRMYGKTVGIDGSYISSILLGRVGVSAWVAWHYGYNQTTVFAKPGARGGSIITSDDMAGILRDTINKSGLSDKEWAEKNGYVPSNISNYMRGLRPVSAGLAEKLGYKRHVIYILETDPEKVVKKKARGRKRVLKTRVGSEVTVQAEEPVLFW